MTEAFKNAFKDIIGYEGGYVNDPLDRGGETKYGISKRWYPNINIKDLTIDESMEIYWNDFWNNKKLNIGLIYEYDQKIAIELFDISINQGVNTSAKYLQRSLNLLNRNEKLFDDIKVDGWVGNLTLDCLNKLKPYDLSALLKCINGLQFMRYYAIVEVDHTQEHNFVGWMKRV